MRYLALFCLVLALPAMAQIYRWLDDQGVTHYSDTKPLALQNVERVEAKANIEQSPESTWQKMVEWLFGDTPKAQSTKPFKEEPARLPVVEMYATSWCGYCRKARQYFAENNVPYVEYDIERDAEARARYDAFRGRGVPIIFIDGERYTGFVAGAIDKKLKER